MTYYNRSRSRYSNSISNVPPWRNRRAAACDNCGIMIAVGTGKLSRCGGGDTGCMRHFDEEGGWHVSCLDRGACAERRQVVLAEQDARARRNDRDAETRQLLREAFADLVTERSADTEDLLTRNDECLELRGYGDTLYGGGAWLVRRGDDWSLVRNNGSDGDDWRYNVVCTGGAGARLFRGQASMDLIARARDIVR